MRICIAAKLLHTSSSGRPSLCAHTFCISCANNLIRSCFIASNLMEYFAIAYSLMLLLMVGQPHVDLQWAKGIANSIAHTEKYWPGAGSIVFDELVSRYGLVCTQPGLSWNA